MREKRRHYTTSHTRRQSQSNIAISFSGTSNLSLCSAVHPRVPSSNLSSNVQHSILLSDTLNYFSTLSIQETKFSSVVATRLRARRPDVRIPKVTRDNSPVQNFGPVRFWGQTSLLFKGHHWFIPGGKAAGAWSWPSSIVEFKNEWSCTHNPNTPFVNLNPP